MSLLKTYTNILNELYAFVYLQICMTCRKIVFFAVGNKWCLQRKRDFGKARWYH